jgi:hypothetical protein
MLNLSVLGKRFSPEPFSKFLSLIPLRRQRNQYAKAEPVVFSGYVDCPVVPVGDAFYALDAVTVKVLVPLCGFQVSVNVVQAFFEIVLKPNEKKLVLLVDGHFRPAAE